MELTDYFNPFDAGDIIKEPGIIMNKVLYDSDKKDKNLAKADLVIIGVPYSDYNLTPTQGPQLIRKAFYELSDHFPDGFQLVDLGDLKEGRTYKDTWIGLRDVLQYVNSLGKFALVLGGTGLFQSAMLESLVEENELIDCVSIEPGISLLPEWEMLSDKLRRKVYYNIIGTQIYYLKKKELEWLEEQQFQDHRLGNVRSSTVTVEPVLRDAHITSISINSIKHADAPGQKKSFPNGFYGEEIAQISRFAGLSDHTKIFGLFDYCPDNDNNGQTSQLAGQICWFVTEGFLNRYPEEPLSGKDIRKFIVNQHDSAYELVFYKSEKTERWWMEIPVKKTKNPAIIACSYDDYRQASEQELPVRWIKAFQRFNLEEV